MKHINDFYGKLIVEEATHKLPFLPEIPVLRYGANEGFDYELATEFNGGLGTAMLLAFSGFSNLYSYPISRIMERKRMVVKDFNGLPISVESVLLKCYFHNELYDNPKAIKNVESIDLIDKVDYGYFVAGDILVGNDECYTIINGVGLDDLISEEFGIEKPKYMISSDIPHLVTDVKLLDLEFAGVSKKGYWYRIDTIIKNIKEEK